MTEFPLKFEVFAETKTGIATPWTSQVNTLSPISTGIPTEFNGPGGNYTPEDFFGLAVLNCIIAAFKVSCEKSRTDYNNLKGKAIVTMDRDRSTNQLIMTHIEITIDIEGASDKEKTKNLLEEAIKTCPVSNSIKSGKTYHLNVN